MIAVHFLPLSVLVPVLASYSATDEAFPYFSNRQTLVEPVLPPVDSFLCNISFDNHLEVYTNVKVTLFEIHLPEEVNYF